MAENQVKRFPFSNKGMVQKLDLNQLEDGQYASVVNMICQQEGALSPRNGYQDIATTWPGATPSLISTIAVTRDQSASNPSVYFTTYRTLYRGDLTGSSSSWSTSPTVIGTSITAADDQTKRIGIAQFKTDQQNNTGTVYFATGYNDPNGFRGMLRDDGSQSTAYYVGILPPAVPAIPTIAAPEIVTVDRDTPYYFTTTRVSTTVVSAQRAENAIGLGTGSTASDDWNIVVSPGGLTDMQTGMYLKVGSLEGIVRSINSSTNTISISLDGTPAPFDAVTSYETSLQSAIPSGGTYRLEGAGGNALLVDLSLSGTASTGYNSNDFIHISYYNGTPEFLKQVRFRFYATANGFYEYTYSVASSSPGADAAPYWQEITVSKSDFTAYGVGSGDASWKSIYVVDVSPIGFADTDVNDLKVGNIIGYGGGGPNSASSGTFSPYDYVYTYLDPDSGAESNPSPIMPDSAGISVANQNINVLVWGNDDSTYGANAIKIAVYRRGGSFTDGAFRRVGLVDNPGLSGGLPASGLFVDTLDDTSIINAKQVSFDNDAPVTSDLNKEYVGTFTATSYYGFTTITPTFSPSVSDLRDILTPGTQVTIGANQLTGSFNQETCTVFSVGSGSFTTFLQYTHVSGEQITWSTKAGMAGDILLVAMDCLWMAGNPDNPHVLYRSKTGQPEAWPVINEATGNSHSIAISSPDNPIMGLAEYNSEIVCLCKNGIYTVRLDNGVLRGPIKTPANRGLFKKHTWGYVDNGIWFLSYDGIYAWNGSSVEKVSFAVDFIFNDLEVNGILPYEKFSTEAIASDNRSDLSCIQQKGNEVFFNYLNTSGQMNVLRYNLLFNRWTLDKIHDSASIVPDYLSNVMCMASDRATGDLFFAKVTSTGSTVTGLAVYDRAGFYKDGGTSAPGTQRIKYEATSKAYDMDVPYTRKNFTDISAEITAGEVASSTSFTLDLYYDYSSVSSDTYNITPTGTGRQMIATPINQIASASGGREGRALQWKVSGYSGALNYWHGLSFGFIPLSELLKGRVTDWSDLGHPYDKRLSSVTIEYDNGGSVVDLYLDTVSGIQGGTINSAVQTITLPAASGRSKITVPINDQIVAKLVRLRPVVSSSQYQIFDFKFVQDNYPADRVYFTDYSDYGYEYEKRLYQLYINCDTNGEDVSVAIEGDGQVLQTVTVNGDGDNRMQPIPLNPDLIAKLIRLKVAPGTFSSADIKFQLFDHKFDFERLPKPIVLSTPWSDFGYNYVKIAEQIAFDVNTNGYDIPVKVYGDGSLKQTVTVNATQASRSVNITLNPAITFQIMRLEVDPNDIPAGGRFQLWEYTPVFKPYDKGAVYHSFDWDDLGHPYDKKISEVTIEFETGHNDGDDGNIYVAIDTLTGIDGATQNLGAIVLQIPNTSQGRGYKTFPLPETICKMIRIRSLGNFGGGTQSPDFKMWGYKFSNTIPYPADILKFTEWTNAGSSCPKIFRGVGVQIDTGGVNCTVGLEVDGAQVHTWTINTTTGDRQTFLSPPDDTEINGNLFRLTFNPGTNGKAQLFGQPDWKLVRDACFFVSLDTYNQAFGSAGYTIIKQIWTDYKCEGTITVRIYNEAGDLFYSKQLPAHATRYPERFYVPSIYNGIINKDKKHRVTITADDPTKPFQLYRDSSRLEFINLSADERKGYYQSIYWENISLAV
jgi:hypothetical protein